MLITKEKKRSSYGQHQDQRIGVYLPSVWRRMTKKKQLSFIRNQKFRSVVAIREIKSYNRVLNNVVCW